MRLVILALGGAVLAGCTPTGGAPGPTAQISEPKPAQASTPGRAAVAASPATDKQKACEQAIADQQKAAALGSALSLAGGLGGFGGYEGAMAGQVASTAGSMLSASQSASARAAVHRDCGMGGLL